MWVGIVTRCSNPRRPYKIYKDTYMYRESRKGSLKAYISSYSLAGAEYTSNSLPTEITLSQHQLLMPTKFLNLFEESYSLINLLLLEPATRAKVGPAALRLEFIRGTLMALQPLMTVRVHRVRPIHHLLAQEIQLPDTNPAVMATTPCEPMLGPEEP